ncbi:MAG: hypothetical protein JNK61_05415 [Bacteroidia bacterium]|nr:hypothetical protein [Bacteroidia bacterium]
MKKILLAMVLLTTTFVSNNSMACDACGKGDPAVELRGAMQKLWADHMQWTFATVDAFYHNQNGLSAQLNRLLKNQKDIGAAIVPVYGQAAGDKLTALLTTHINQAVPVLTAAKSGDQAALKKALDDWYANAQEIADFLASANSKNWKQEDLRAMMKLHIDETTGYAVELLKGNYEEAVKKFDKANDDMKKMSDELAMGIVKQFPDKFKKTNKK